MKNFQYTIANLETNTRYIFNITSFYSNNLKEKVKRSICLKCSTKVNAPEFVSEPKILIETNAYVTLQLLRADENLGKIEYYHLIVVPYKNQNNSIFIEYHKNPNSYTLIELSMELKDKFFPFLAFSKSTNNLFKDSNLFDYKIFAISSNEENVIQIDTKITYRAALRACVEINEGQFLCNTSKWSNEFKINDRYPSSNTGTSKNIKLSGSRYSTKDRTIITVAIALCGISIAIISMIIGCVVHRRKSSKRHFNSQERLSSPELLQDTQMAPLFERSTPKIDRSSQYLKNNPNFISEVQTDSTLITTFRRNSYRSPVIDSKHSYVTNNKIQIVNPDSTPDLVNVKANFNYYSQDSPLLSSAKQLEHVISVQLLPAFIEEAKQYDAVKLMLEFEELNKGNYENISANVSNLPNNKLKNRYANVVAYDNSLVLLQNGVENQENNYINANYIDGYRKQNEYIATQGPLIETINDFWQMVWEQRSLFIVMLINVEDSESKKCETYWPKKGTRTYKSIDVTLVKEMKKAYYIIRQFQLKQNGLAEKRLIYHLHFTYWPDQGIPILCAPLLSLVKVYRNLKKLECGPTVVHCSAGVGRTGVFIVLDTQIEKLKHEKCLNVFDQVKKMRKQRNYMVQTEAQYGYLFDLLHEWSETNVDDISPELLVKYVERKNQFQEVLSLSGFELEFQQLNLQTSKYINDFTKINGNSTINKQKNNSSNFKPFDWNRVILSSIEGVNGSDYINASFIDSYLQTKAYIVTQNPMSSTVEDFWRLVWDHSCSIIVVLGKLKEFIKEQSLPYWPIQKSIRYQFFVVDPLVEYNMCHYIMREFKVTDARDGEYRTIRQFHYSKWSDNAIPSDCNSFLDFTNQVQLTKEKFGHGTPLLVHCSYGTGKSGIYIGVNNILEKLRQDHVVNVYGVVKLIQQQRLGLVQTFEQYKFLYYEAYSYLMDIKNNSDDQFHKKEKSQHL